MHSGGLIGVECSKAGFGEGLDEVDRPNRIGRGVSMDVTGIISELRTEREEIEQAILSLERFDRLRTGTRGEAGAIRGRDQNETVAGRCFVVRRDCQAQRSGLSA